jgi:hypothetical protein
MQGSNSVRECRGHLSTRRAMGDVLSEVTTLGKTELASR